MNTALRLLIFTGILSILTTNPFTGYAQSKEDKQQLQDLQLRTRAAYDSFFNGDHLKNLREEYKSIMNRSRSYTAISFYYDVSRANIDGFNADLKASGLPEMRNTFHSIGFGFTRKNKRIPTHLLFNIGLGNSVSNANHSVRLAATGFSLDKGYAVIDNDKMMLHPFVGIGIQGHSIKVTEKHPDGTVNNLLDIPEGSVKGKLFQNSFYAMLGAQFSYNVYYSKNSSTGLQFALRFAYNPVFATGKYKYNNENSNYKPDIKFRQYNLSLLVNIYTKNVFR